MASGSLTRSQLLLAVLFATTGVGHFIIPDFFVQIVPSSLPSPELLVAVSGVAEILGALGVLVPTTRRAAGWGLIALLFAVFPANVNMLWMAMRHGASPAYLTGLWLRLPLQGVLIWWVYRATIAQGRRREAVAGA
jgi:uncharacterized membrane protein